MQPMRFAVFGAGSGLRFRLMAWRGLNKAYWPAALAIILFAFLFAVSRKRPAPPAAPPSHATPAPAPVEKPFTVGVSFGTPPAGFRVALLGVLKTELVRNKGVLVQAVADGDANRQIEQVKSFITNRVSGILLVPQEPDICLPIVRAANAANIPIVLFDYPVEARGARSVAVIADHRGLARETAATLIGEGRKTGKKQRILLLTPDLDDSNANARRNGFETAIDGAPDAIEEVVRVPAERDSAQAQAAALSALQAHPGINLIFSSSDSLLPAIAAALTAAGQYRKIGEPGHVILGGFDGAPAACRMVAAGYLDAVAVQDVAFEAEACIRAILDMRAHRSVPAIIKDPGLVITQANFKQLSSHVWSTQEKE